GPESARTASRLGRGCGRSGRWLLRALAYRSTDVRARVLVAAFGSARPASQSASSVRWTRAQSFSQQGVHPLGVGATLRKLHHLADQEAKRLRLAALEVLRRLCIFRDHLVDPGAQLV